MVAEYKVAMTCPLTKKKIKNAHKTFYFDLQEQVGSEPVHTPTALPSTPTVHLLSSSPPAKKNPLLHVYVAMLPRSNSS